MEIFFFTNDWLWSIALVNECLQLWSTCHAHLSPNWKIPNQQISSGYLKHATRVASVSSLDFVVISLPSIFWIRYAHLHKEPNSEISHSYNRLFHLMITNMKYICPADLHPNWKIPNQQYLLNVLNMQRVLRKGFRLSFGYVINISCHTQ